MGQNRHQRRASSVTIAKSDRATTQSAMRQAEERGEQRGLQIGVASQNLQSAVMYLAAMIDSLDQLVMITEGLPASAQGLRMREMILRTENVFGRTTLTKEQQLRLAAFDVRDALRDTAPHLAYINKVFPFSRQHAENTGRVGLAYADLIHDLMMEIDPNLPEKDARKELNRRMKALSDFVRQRGGSTGDVIFQQMGQSSPKPGAPAGPQPVTKYTLEQTAYLAKLHNLKTRGAKVEKLMETLRERSDVKDWQTVGITYKPGIERDGELAKRSVQVQVFARFDGLSRKQSADVLEGMEDHHRGWSAKQGG